MNEEQKHEAMTEVKEALDMYVREGLNPGDFLIGVLDNNLFDAVVRADNRMFRILEEVVRYVSTFVPPNAKGSREKVDKWMAQGGQGKGREAG